MLGKSHRQASDLRSGALQPCLDAASVAKGGKLRGGFFQSQPHIEGPFSAVVFEDFSDRLLSTLLWHTQWSEYHTSPGSLMDG